MANLPVVDFCSQVQEMSLPSHWICSFQFIFSYVGFPPLQEKFEHHCLWAIWIFSVLSHINKKSCNKVPTIENCEGLTIHSSTWPRGAKGEQHVSSRLAISNTLEKIVFYHVCCYSFSQNWKSLYNTLVNMTYHLDRGHFFNRSNCSFS